MHEEVFTPNARKLFPLLAQFKGFYLVGGTALALQIGHRVSVDFDMFTERSLHGNLYQKIKRTFATYPIQVTYRSSGQINLIVADVKCTFFSYQYPVCDPYVMFKKVPLASVYEIAAMKALAVGGRLAYKDYVDWYFLLNGRHVDLQVVIEHAKKKFGGDFSDRLFLGQLVSFDDVPTQHIDFFKKNIPRKTIETFIGKKVKRFMAPVW
jgi:hypothetical protein